LVEQLDALPHNGVGTPRHDLVGPHLVLEVLDEVGAEDAPEATERHRDIESEAPTRDGLLIQLLLVQEEHAEGVQARVAQAELVTLVVLPEAAGTAGAGREVHVALDRLLGPVLLGFPADEVDEIAGGEAGGAA